MQPATGSSKASKAAARMAAELISLAVEAREGEWREDDDEDQERGDLGREQREHEEGRDEEATGERPGYLRHLLLQRATGAPRHLVERALLEPGEEDERLHEKTAGEKK